eukprot:COSAG05_NODE_2364_length_3173_cov_6.975856_2_plen_134_part_00
MDTILLHAATAPSQSQARGAGPGNTTFGNNPQTVDLSEVWGLDVVRHDNDCHQSISSALDPLRPPFRCLFLSSVFDQQRGGGGGGGDCDNGREDTQASSSWRCDVVDEHTHTHTHTHTLSLSLSPSLPPSLYR